MNLQAELAFACKTKKDKKLGGALGYTSAVELQNKADKGLQGMIDTTKMLRPLALDCPVSGPIRKTRTMFW